MSISAGGRGVTPPFNPTKYRGAPPEILALVREIEQRLAAPVEGEAVAGSKTQYVATADNLDSFVVKGGQRSAKVLGIETMSDKTVVSWMRDDGKTEQSPITAEVLDLVQKRNRALTQLEVFLQEQLSAGKVGSDKKDKLQDILSNVSQYQSSLTHSIDRQLKISERVLGGG